MIAPEGASSIRGISRRHALHDVSAHQSSMPSEGLGQALPEQAWCRVEPGVALQHSGLDDQGASRRYQCSAGRRWCGRGARRLETMCLWRRGWLTLPDVETFEVDYPFHAIARSCARMRWTRAISRGTALSHLDVLVCRVSIAAVHGIETSFGGG